MTECKECTIIGYKSEVKKGSRDVIIGYGNDVEGDANIVIGNNNKISGNGNFVIGHNLSIIGDNHYIISSLDVNIQDNFKSLLFNNQLIHKLILFTEYINKENYPKDIIRYVTLKLYDIRLNKGEAISYCSSMIRDALQQLTRQ
jgi:hypothetical protein